jgi:hypothetical protein
MDVPIEQPLLTSNLNFLLVRTINTLEHLGKPESLQDPDCCIIVGPTGFLRTGKKGLINIQRLLP